MLDLAQDAAPYTFGERSVEVVLRSLAEGAGRQTKGLELLVDVPVASSLHGIEGSSQLRAAALVQRAAEALLAQGAQQLLQ